MVEKCSNNIRKKMFPCVYYCNTVFECCSLPYKIVLVLLCSLKFKLRIYLFSVLGNTVS